MSEPDLQTLYFRAIRDGDAETVRRLLDQHPDVLATPPMLATYFHDAAQFDRVAILEILLARGAEINATVNASDPRTPIHRAAGDGAADAVRWLLGRGAVIVTADEEDPCPGLSFAAMDGHLECVRLLVEAGAPLETAGSDALHLAKVHGHPEVAAYLRSVGVADDEGDDEPGGTPELADAGEGLPDLRRHLEQQLLGRIAPDAFREVLPNSPPIQVLVLDQFGVRTALVTEGMSRQPMRGPVPYAELVMYLPPEWPLGREAFADERHAWPALWLWRLARFPHQAGGGYEPAVRFDYEEPLAPGCRFTAFLLLAGSGERETYTRADGELVRLYTVLPIYPEENDLAEREGLPRLLTLFDERGIPRSAAIDRPSALDAP